MKYVAGDILLVRDYTGGSDLLGNLILAGQRARYGNSDFARWTHSALIVSEDGDLVEALSEGIRRTNISKYAGHETLVIPAPATVTPEMRALAVAGALEQVGTDYNFVDFVSLAFQLLFGLKLSVQQTGRFICSQLCARYTEKYVSSYPLDPSQLMPADLGHYYDAISGDPLPPLSLLGRALDKFRAVVWALQPWRRGLRK